MRAVAAVAAAAVAAAGVQRCGQNSSSSVVNINMIARSLAHRSLKLVKAVSQRVPR